MKKANWLKDQDAKQLAYIFHAEEDMEVVLPWRKAYLFMPIPLARIT
jgi:hypothetical protein